MLKYKIMLVCVIISLFALSSTKVIAEPTEIYRSPNIKVYAFEKVLDRWGEQQWSYFYDLVMRESEWLNTAQNPNSTAYGIGQFLNSTWAIVGCEKTSDSYKQIDCMIEYVVQRYDDPKRAIHHHKLNNWY